MNATAIFLTCLAGIAALWELLGVLSGRGLIPVKIPLISPVMRYNGQIWLFWPWGWGVLPGHWWFPWPARDGAWMLLVVATAVIVALDIQSRVLGHKNAKWMPFATFCLGIVAGSAFWAMGY